MASIQKLTLLQSQTLTVDTTSDIQATENGMVDLVGVLVMSAVVGAAPTVDVKIEHSIDGSNWFDLCTFAQLTTTGKEYKHITIPALSQVRAVVDLGGTITSATLKVELASRDARR